jgi:glycosyltransferase involved in cell wall biosynthesis
MANAENPLVSIIMCTYNGAAFVQPQLASLLQQSYPALEIIISDDASTDDTLELVKQLGSNDPRLRIIARQQNLGYNQNFLTSCREAKGEYIAICDQDDIWHPDKISIMMNKWVDDVLLMYCNSVRFSGNNVPVNPSDNPLYRRFEGKDLRKIAVFNTISGHAMLMRKELLTLISPLPKGVMYDWWAGAVAACNNGVGYVPDILVYQRMHGDNVSVGKSFTHLDPAYKRQFNEMVALHQRAFAQAPNISPSAKIFMDDIANLWEMAMNKKFSWSLFLFLFKNRTVIFWYKRKKFNLISHIKHSYKLAKNP